MSGWQRTNQNTLCQESNGPNWIPHTGMGYYFLVSGQRGPIDPQTLMAIVTALDWHPELDGRAVLLMTPLPWKFGHYRLAFTVVRDAVYTARRERLHWIVGLLG